MLAAVFGLFGVIVGALTASASTWFFTRRREKREGQVATRLVREDVILSGSTLENVLRSGWWPELALPLEYWREHRSMLAGYLSASDWEQVAIAMGSVERTEVMFASISGGKPIASGDIPDDGRQIIGSTIKYLKSANEILSESDESRTAAPTEDT